MRVVPPLDRRPIRGSVGDGRLAASSSGVTSRLADFRPLVRCHVHRRPKL